MNSLKKHNGKTDDISKHSLCRPPLNQSLRPSSRHKAMFLLKCERLTGFKNCRIPLTRTLSIGFEEPVLFETVGTAGVVTLNRPKKLNALTYRMWELLTPQLRDWETSRSHIIIKGAGDKAFSAGGDVKWLANLDSNHCKFIYETYVYNGMYTVSKYKIPYISLMDGITFGGACALALHGRYRVATERTVTATPETLIGWVTDASATYFLSRLDNHLGVYMGLTGARLKGQDTVLAGLATHFIQSNHLRDIELKLRHCNADDIEGYLNAYNEPLGEFSLAPIIKDIDYCFSADTVEEIIERLKKTNNSWSLETVERLSRMCPTMLKVSLRAIQRGKTSNMKQCILTEVRCVFRVIDSYNAYEGVTSLLVDKRQPKWQPASLAEVTDAMVDSYFEPLPDGDPMFTDDDTTIIIPKPKRA